MKASAALALYSFLTLLGWIGQGVGVPLFLATFIDADGNFTTGPYFVVLFCRQARNSSLCNSAARSSLTLCRRLLVQHRLQLRLLAARRGRRVRLSRGVDGRPAIG